MPTSPAHIVIKGQQVLLAPAMTYGEAVGPYLPPGAQPPITIVEYDSIRTEVGDSWITFDRNFMLLDRNVRPEDQDEFQPVFDALSSQ